MTHQLPMAEESRPDADRDQAAPLPASDSDPELERIRRETRAQLLRYMDAG